MLRYLTGQQFEYLRINHNYWKELTTHSPCFLLNRFFFRQIFVQQKSACGHQFRATETSLMSKTSGLSVQFNSRAIRDRLEALEKRVREKNKNALDFAKLRRSVGVFFVSCHLSSIIIDDTITTRRRRLGCCSCGSKYSDRPTVRVRLVRSSDETFVMPKLRCPGCGLVYRYCSGNKQPSCPKVHHQLIKCDVCGHNGS